MSEIKKSRYNSANKIKAIEEEQERIRQQNEKAVAIAKTVGVGVVKGLWAGIKTTAYYATTDKEERKEDRKLKKELDAFSKKLELEFLHLQRTLELQGNIDQGKLNKLQEMQQTLKSQKMSDLEMLRKQIDMMKRGG